MENILLRRSAPVRAHECGGGAFVDNGVIYFVTTAISVCTSWTGGAPRPIAGISRVMPTRAIDTASAYRLRVRDHRAGGSQSIRSWRLISMATKPSTVSGRPLPRA
jgi:hypothetical protein